MELKKAIGIVEAVKAGTAEVFINKDSIDQALEKAIEVMKVLDAMTEEKIIYCKDCVRHKDNRCLVANHHTSDMENCVSVFGAKRRKIDD